MSSERHRPEAEIIPPGHDAPFASGGMDGFFNSPLAMPRITYALYAIASVSAFPMLIGLIVAYVARAEAPEWVKGHYTFLIGTFWIGILWFVIGLVTFFAGIGMFVLWVLPLWYVIRVARGWIWLENRRMVPNPSSLLFG